MDSNGDGRLLARVDERTQNIEDTLREIRKQLELFESRFATKEELRPIKGIVYGGVAVALTAIAAGLLALLGFK